MTEPRYALREPVGEGGMGRVFRAWDRVLERVVALKTLRPDRVDERLRARFLVEMRVAARIAHPHVVPILDVGALPGGLPFLAMPLAEGSLARARGWARLLPRLFEVLAALAALHARGVLHRDLKPDNVLLIGGRACVADLGLALVADLAAERLSDRSGTPRFMPLEQQEGDVARFGPPLDLYAFGAMVAALAADDPVPDGLADLLDALLQPDPTRRPALAADVARALRALGPPVRPLPGRFHAAVAGETFATVDEGGRGRAARAARRPVGPAAAAPLAGGPARRGGGRGPALAGAVRAPADAARRPRGGAGAALGARAGRGEGPRVVVVEGEAGVGKSRLVASITRALEELGLARTLRLRPAPDAPAADPRPWLAANADRGRVVWWIDDAQAAPPEVLEQATALAADRLPVLVVVCVRREERDRIAAALAELAAAGAERIALERLDEVTTRALLAGALALGEEVLARAVERCEGNPRLARELVLHWAETGALVDEGGLRYRLRHEAAIDAVPAGAADLLERRLATAEARAPALAATLDRLALAGRRIPGPVLARLAGPLADAALATGLLRRDGEGAAWDHPLLREAARARAVARPDAPARWREVADAWLACGGADAAIGLALAEAGEPAAALPYLQRVFATPRRHGVGGDPEALSRALLACAERAGTAEDRAWARLARARVLARGPRKGEAIAEARQGLVDARGPVEVALRAHLAWTLLVTLEVDAAGEQARQAVALGEGLGDPAAQVEALRILALWHRHRDELDLAIAAVRRAIAAAEAAGDPVAVADLLPTLARDLLAAGRNAEAEALATDALARARRVDRPKAEGHCLQILAVLAVRRGDPAGAEGRIREAIDRLARAGVGGVAHLRATLAEILIARGDPAGARAALEAFLRYAIEGRLHDQEFVARANLAQLAVVEGDPDALRRELPPLERLVRPGGRGHALVAALRACERAAAADRAGAGAALAEITLATAEVRELAPHLRARLLARGWDDLAAGLDAVLAP